MSRRLWLILALTLLLRLGSLAWVYERDATRVFTPDSYQYQSIAIALARTGHFAPDAAHPSDPEVIRTPGYPLFIASFYRIFGERPWVPLAAQILISVLTIALVYRLTRRLWGEPAALAAVALLAIDANSFLYSQLMLTETIFGFFALLSICAAVLWIENPSRTRWAAGMGLCLALATQIRPITLYYIWPVALAMIVFAWRRRLGARVLARALVCLFVPWIVLIGGWQYHNYRVTGSWKLSHIDSVNLLLYRGAGVVSLMQHIPLEVAQQQLEREMAIYESDPPVVKYNHYATRGLALVEAHPFLHLRLQAIGLAKMVFSTGMGSVWGYLFQRLPTGPLGDLARLKPRQYLHEWVLGRPIALACFTVVALYVAVFYAFMICGLGRVWREDRARLFLHAFIWMFIAYLFIVPAGPEAYSRFKVPIMPLMALYAGYGWMACKRRK